MIARLLRTLLTKRKMDAALARRRRARDVLSEAARKGQSTYWRESGERNRALFGVGD